MKREPVLLFQLVTPAKISKILIETHDSAHFENSFVIHENIFGKGLKTNLIMKL